MADYEMWVEDRKLLTLLWPHVREMGYAKLLLDIYIHGYIVIPCLSRISIHILACHIFRNGADLDLVFPHPRFTYSGPGGPYICPTPPRWLAENRVRLATSDKPEELGSLTSWTWKSTF